MKNAKLFGLLCLSPFLAVLIIVGWMLLTLGDWLIQLLTWPYRVLGGIVGTILGGGKR